MNAQIIIDSIPTDCFAADHLRLADGPMPSPGQGELLVATRLLSIDAANRAWLQGQTYRNALAEGSVMAGLAIAEVVTSLDPAFVPGDLIFADCGWQQFAVVRADRAVRQRRDVPITHLLSLYGTSTLTAYFGLLDVGQLRAGDTVVISAAGGSVGTAAAQIALLKGATVIGIAGGPDKCRWLSDWLGLSTCLDYKDPDFGKQLRAATPGGIDLYFDNVGGAVLDRCLFAMALHGRVACCGAVSSYDSGKPVAGPRGVPGLLITRRVTMRGFLVDDFADQRDAALRDIDRWVADGLLRPVEDIVEGLEQAPTALLDQLAGRSRGKKMVVVQPGVLSA